MAGDWIKMRNNLWNDPRVSRICDITDQPEAMIVGGLYWLWSTADEHTEDGFMCGLSLRGVDRKTGIKAFGEALATVGWVEEHADGLQIVRFCEHNGASAKRRSMEARRKANARKESARDADTDETRSGNHAELDLDLDTSTDSDESVVTGSADDSADDAGKTPASASPPTCPHQEIIKIYHECLPSNPRIRDWTPARQEQLRCRWQEATERQNLDYWRRFFVLIATRCPFLTGQRTGTKGRPFRPGLEWMVKKENFTKIREGRYVEDEAA